MADANLDLILEMLRRLQGDVRDIKETLRDHTQRLGRIEQGAAYYQVAHADQQISIDRLRERVERIETRLDLRDT